MGADVCISKMGPVTITHVVDHNFSFLYTDLYKLLEHAMKVVESIFDHRIRQQIVIDDMQFGFMKGKGTTDAIFMARQMQERKCGE